MKKKSYVILFLILQSWVFFNSMLISPIQTAKPNTKEAYNDSNQSIKASSNKLIKKVLDHIQLNHYNTSGQQFPYICALSNDTFVAAWSSYEQDGDLGGVYARVFNTTTGENITSEFQVNYNITNTQGDPSICALSSDTIAITWMSREQDGDDDGVYACVFNATTGINITSEFRVNNYIIGVQNKPSICALSDQTFAVAWSGNGTDGDLGDVYACVFNATTGNNITSEFLINHYTTNSQYGPSICTLSNDTFAIAWVSREQDGDGDGVYAIVFNTTTGTNTTSELQVNQFVDNAQGYSSICSVTSDIFAVTWTSWTQDGDTGGIYARVFNATTGNNITSEFRVNYYTKGVQGFPSICAPSNDTLAMTWESYGQSFIGYNVYTRVFNASTGKNITSEFQVGNSTVGGRHPSICALKNGTFAVAWQAYGPDGDHWGVFFSNLRLINQSSIPNNGNQNPSEPNDETDKKDSLKNDSFIEDDLVAIVVVSVVIGSIVVAATIASLYIFSGTKSSSTLLQKLRKNRLRKLDKIRFKKKRKKKILIKEQILSKYSEEILAELSNKKELLELFNEVTNLEEIPTNLTNKVLTIISKDFLFQVDQIGFEDPLKREFLKEMLSFSPKERGLIVEDILKNTIIYPIPPIKPEKDKQKEILVVYEDYALELVQEYLEKNRFFEVSKIIPFLTSRFSKASININVNGIKKILRSLIEKNILVEGSKMVKNDVLTNSNRKEIYEFIQKNPGVHFNRLFKISDLSSAVVRWHINMLLKFGFIRKESIGNHDAYFDLQINLEHDQLLHLISRKKYLNLIEFLDEYDEGISKTQLTKELGMHFNTVNKYINKLRDLELINLKKYGNENLIFLNKELYTELKKKIISNIE